MSAGVGCYERVCVRPLPSTDLLQSGVGWGANVKFIIPMLSEHSQC